MAKPNVQILRIWTFAKKKIYKLRRPSIFLPSHIWLRFFCRAIYGSVKKTGFPPISKKSEETTVLSGHRSSIDARRKHVKKTCEKNGFSSDFDTFSSSDISPDSGSPQIPKESEGTAVLPIPKESERKARFFSRAIYGTFFPRNL